VKVCSSVAPTIRNFQHTQMNEHEWSRLLTIVENERQAFRKEIVLAEETESYWKHIKDLLTKHLCSQRCGGKVRLKQYTTKVSQKQS
jgi:hypothetical protein